MHKKTHHVIFVVHGMGRQLEEFGNYERNVSYFVENTKTVLQTQFHNLKTNVHIIPIEWHAKLHSMVDERMALASLRTVPKVRLVMNDYFADILYYFNNHYGAEIVRMIVDELNEAYEIFLAKHPDFNGKISVYALSLGGVAMFDILTCMDDDELEDKHREADQNTPEHKNASNASDPALSASATSPSTTVSQERPRIRKQDQPKYRSIIPKLKFRPNYLFTVGSPVGAVMVMRNLDWDTFHPPDDIIHHNLFHPFDPLAYRIEPLIDSTFAAIPAVTLSSYGNSQLFPLSLPSLSSIPLIPESLSAFWETKVPALPRPSIPTLSTLSQMTQSLKAGRWLSGTGNGNQTSGASTPSNARDDNQSSVGQDNTIRDNQHSSESESESEGQKRHRHEDHPVHVKSQLSRRLDADVSAQEAIAAVAAATYLDQRESGTRPVDSPMLGADATTTIGSEQFTPSPSRRPSLGPRSISSRVEDDIENGKQEDTSKKMPGVQEELDLEPKNEDRVTSLTQASAGPSDEIPPPLKMEFYLGMENGPTAQEKADAQGAKSNVVQEDMVRSMSNSPGLDRHESAQAGDESASRSDKKVTIETVEDEDEGEDEAGKPMAGSTDGKRQKLHVGGRPTKVPYRIDHVLQESTVDQYTNEYLLGMRSHFRYWGNRDIAYHILKSMLHPEGAVVGGDVLELTPEMPAPITAPKGVKEAAEAKAKAAAAAYHSSKKEQDTKAQHRKSFSFSFFGNEGSSEDRDGNIQSRPSMDSYDGYGLDVEGELYGYRYSDLDMGSAANVGLPSNTLYQNSPFAKSTSPSSTSMTYEYRHEQSKRRSSSSASMRYAYVQHQQGSASATSSTATPTATTATGAQPSVVSPTHSQGAFDEGVIVVPDLAKPAKLHHRSSRVEEKR
ncbi:hypothetical protein BGZ52_012205 [Haplosporangium bisporale]|nr:hypothetical protein BGZ52_012205 [Haplosporangium bisporale]